MTDFSIYDADYFLRGKETGKSLYENYRWLNSLTVPMARRIAEVLRMDRDDTILDFGCARGYVVRAFREIGYSAYGVDASAWAIENCDPSVRDFVWRVADNAESDFYPRGTMFHYDAPIVDPESREYDWVIAKDVLEHIPKYELERTLNHLFKMARKGLFVVVPLSPETDAPYVVPEYEQDVTHVQRLTLGDWTGKLTYGGFCTSACYRVRGVKDNYSHFERGNGFIFVRREEGSDTQ